MDPEHQLPQDVSHDELRNIATRIRSNAWELAERWSEVAAQSAPANTPRLTKYMILLTDGDNTQNRFGDNQSAMDDRTEAACKSAKATGIQIFSIRVIDGDRDLLRGCASDPGMYYEVSNASQLAPIFQQIAREISQIRLTM